MSDSGKIDEAIEAYKQALIINPNLIAIAEAILTAAQPNTNRIELVNRYDYNQSKPVPKVLSACIIASFLLWMIYRLLMRLELGLPAECFFMTQVCVVLLMSTLLCRVRLFILRLFLGHVLTASAAPSTAYLLTLSSISTGRWLLRQLLVSQVPVLCWVFLSTGAALFITDLQFTAALQIFAILGIYSLAGGCCWNVVRAGFPRCHPRHRMCNTFMVCFDR